jgi:hypothetical protein
MKNVSIESSGGKNYAFGLRKTACRQKNWYTCMYSYIKLQYALVYIKSRFYWICTLSTWSPSEGAKVETAMPTSRYKVSVLSAQPSPLNRL